MATPFPSSSHRLAARHVIRPQTPLLRLRGAIADLKECASEYRPDPADLSELAARLARIADAFEGRADE